ncbi:MAG: DUF624 domain-containing protein [Clostridia bacterium]|nr:DUF624 domain-containing protein [Clostridia bacterium]
MNKQPNKKKFRLFDMNRDGRGVEKGEDTTPNLKFYFKLLARRFPSLLSLNLLMNLQILPIVIGFLAYFFTEKTPSQASAIFAPIYGVSQIDPSVTASTILSVFGIQFNIPIYNNPAYWVIGGCIVFLVLTMGWQTVGATYVLRGMVRHDAVFVFSDYFYAIKRNFKEGFLYGLFDSLIIIVLIIDFLFFYTSTGDALNNFMFWTISALIVLYMLMRPYIYMMLITFDMKLKKILKNALIFAILGIKRNVMWIVGVAMMAILNIALMIVCPPSIIIPVILPFFYFWGFVGFTVNYAVYPIIDRYMIAPCRKDGDDGGDDTDRLDDDGDMGEPDDIDASYADTV